MLAIFAEVAGGEGRDGGAEGVARDDDFVGGVGAARGGDGGKDGGGDFGPSGEEAGVREAAEGEGAGDLGEDEANGGGGVSLRWEGEGRGGVLDDPVADGDGAAEGDDDGALGVVDGGEAADVGDGAAEAGDSGGVLGFDERAKVLCAGDFLAGGVGVVAEGCGRVLGEETEVVDLCNRDGVWVALVAGVTVRVERRHTSWDHGGRGGGSGCQGREGGKERRLHGGGLGGAGLRDQGRTLLPTWSRWMAIARRLISCRQAWGTRGRHLVFPRGGAIEVASPPHYRQAVL